MKLSPFLQTTSSILLAWPQEDTDYRRENSFFHLIVSRREDLLLTCSVYQCPY